MEVPFPGAFFSEERKHDPVDSFYVQVTSVPLSFLFQLASFHSLSFPLFQLDELFLFILVCDSYLAPAPPIILDQSDNAVLPFFLHGSCLSLGCFKHRPRPPRFLPTDYRLAAPRGRSLLRPSGESPFVIGPPSFQNPSQLFFLPFCAASFVLEPGSPLGRFIGLLQGPASRGSLCFETLFPNPGDDVLPGQGENTDFKYDPFSCPLPPPWLSRAILPFLLFCPTEILPDGPAPRLRFSPPPANFPILFPDLRRASGRAL